MIRGRAVGPPADLYALGAVGSFLLTGKPIFDGETALAMVSQHLTADPIPPSARGVEVPADLERLLLRCLAKEPQDRPPSADALRRELLALGCAGGWTPADARAWWESRRPEGGSGEGARTAV
jgi:serine/threonine-protein kinase